jgi:ribosomal protein S18 acetylase RimI-like enzyme
MPMTSQHIPMSYEAWRCLPYQPGWKCEYFDGCAHITPTHQIAVTQVAVTPRSVTAPCLLRPVLASDEAALLPVYMQVFADNQAFCDYTEARFHEAARKDLGESFHGRRGSLLAASRVAINTRGATSQLIGAALLSRDSGYGPVLDLIFVLPAWHRRGVATALASEAANVLAQDGEQTLTSCYQLANVTSQNWHQSFGFVELPDLQYAQVYRRQAQRELYRCEQSGDTASETHARLMAELAHWCDRVETLQRIDDEQGFWAVYPRIPHW